MIVEIQYKGVFFEWNASRRRWGNLATESSADHFDMDVEMEPGQKTDVSCIVRHLSMKSVRDLLGASEGVRASQAVWKHSIYHKYVQSARRLVWTSES